MRLYYPIKPNSQNQGFGANPQYYAKFTDNNGNPLKGHDGIDFFAMHGTQVFAAHDGMIHYEKDSHGGEGMWIRGTECTTLYWHLIGDTDGAYPSPIALDGKEYPVKTGDLIGYADNTGAPYESTGTHLHFGLLPLSPDYGNGYNGRIDSTGFFTGYYAQDYTTIINLLVTVKNLLTSYLQGRITSQ